MNGQEIKLQRGMNFRDLGGLTGLHGKQVISRKLVRGGHLASLTPIDQSTLTNYGISRIIDLRSTAEITKYPDIVPDGMTYDHIPVLDNDDTESTETAEKLQEEYSTNARAGSLQMQFVYRKMVVSRHAQRAYHDFLTTLLNYGEQETILFHCSAGKDRTGICTLLLLSILDVQPENIVTDYMLTNKSSVNRIKARVSEALTHHMNCQFIQSICDLSTVSLDYLEQALMLINYEFGGIMQYLTTDIGITEADISKLRRIYLTH